MINGPPVQRVKPLKGESFGGQSTLVVQGPVEAGVGQHGRFEMAAHWITQRLESRFGY